MQRPLPGYTAGEGCTRLYTTPPSLHLWVHLTLLLLLPAPGCCRSSDTCRGDDALGSNLRGIPGWVRFNPEVVPNVSGLIGRLIKDEVVVQAKNGE